MQCLYNGGDGNIFLSPSRDGVVVVGGCEEKGRGFDFSSNVDFGVDKEIGLVLPPPTGGACGACGGGCDLVLVFAVVGF
jgi:hypothetical protein